MRPNILLMMIVAIVFELVGTTSLKLTGGGSRPLWYVPVVVGYAGAFYVFSIAVRTLPLGVAYAVWAGLGIVGTTIIGRFIFGQFLPPLTVLGIALILLGTVIVNLSSASVAH